MSGNASYDRTPKGWFQNVSDRLSRLEHRIPGAVAPSTGGGFNPPEVAEHPAIVTRNLPANTTFDSWYGGYEHVDFVTMVAASSGVLNNAAMEMIRQYPYAIYDAPAVGFANKYGLEVDIYKGDVVNQDYPGTGDAGGDVDAEYVYIAPSYWGGSDTFTVTEGDILTLVLIWWDTEPGHDWQADIGGLETAINGALAGVDLTARSWRSTIFTGYKPSFELGPDGYYSQRSTQIGAVGVGSVAEGVHNLAVGIGAHAEGSSNQAIGDASHAEGQNNKVYAWASHAEGANHTIFAGAYYSHAEGDSHEITGAFSHAEGGTNWSQGYGGHVEGSNTTVTPSGSAGHAEGAATHVDGPGSHAEGLHTVAHRPHEHARGSGWGSDSLMFASRVIGAYPANVTGSSYMIRPFGLSGWAPLVLNRGRATRLEIFVLGIAADESMMACWRIIGMAYWPSSGNARTVGTPTVTKEFGDAGTAGWAVSIAITTTGEIRVTTNPGVVSSRWSGVFHLTEVPFSDLYF